MYNYCITREDYLALLREVLDKERRKVRSILMFFFYSVGFPIATGYLVIHSESPLWFRILCGTLSAFLMIVGIFRTFFLNYRAGLTLKMAEQRGELHPDYWKEHKLTLKEKNLKCRYGEIDMTVPCEKITQITELKGFHVLYAGKNIVEAIPENAMSADEWEALKEGIREAAHARAREDLLRHYETTSRSAVLIRKMKLTEDEVAENLVKLRRRGYISTAGWTRPEIFHVVGPVLILCFCIYMHSLIYTLLGIVLLISFNTQLILVFTPLYRKIVRASVQPADEDGCYTLVVAFKELYIYTRYRVFTFKLNELKKEYMIDGLMMLFFPKQQMLFIPMEYAAEFHNAIHGKRRISEKARIDSAYTDSTGEESSGTGPAGDTLSEGSANAVPEEIRAEEVLNEEVPAGKDSEA